MITGAKVYIEGALQTRKWTDKDGIEKYSTEIVLQGFNSALTMLDARKDGDERDPEPQHGSAPARPPVGRDMDDEIPFSPELR